MNSEQRKPIKALLSISLDLAGSTDIKQAIIVQSEGQPEHRKQLYDKYLRMLFSVEQTFYELVQANEALTVDRLSLVKTIGDEFWYVYEVDERGRGRTSARRVYVDGRGSRHASERDFNCIILATPRSFREERTGGWGRLDQIRAPSQGHNRSPDQRR